MDKLQELIDCKNAIMQDGDNNGKLSARKRIGLLFDEGSFIETDIFSGRCDGAAAEGVITGYGTVDSRLAFVYAQDGNAKGGAFGVEQAKKICRIMDMALKAGAPCVALLDSCGVQIDDGIAALSAMGEVYARTAKCSGAILQIAAVFGTCAGGAALSPTTADVLLMTEKSCMMLCGPALCASEGNKLTADDIGSAEVNATLSGTAQIVAKDDEAVIAEIRKILSMLPGNCEELAPEIPCTDDLNRLSASFGTEQPVKDMIGQIVDNGEFFEWSSAYAGNMITGLAHFNGRTVAIVANNGELDGNASDKAARFIRFADCFNLPIVTLCNVSGFAASADEERNGIIRRVSKLAYAYTEASTPKVTVITKSACTSAAVVMGSKALGADFVLAWPEAVIGAVSPDMASALLYDETIKMSADPVKERENVKAYYSDQVATALAAARVGFVNDVIEPDTTRPRIAAALEMLYNKSEEAPCKKHGNMAL